MDSKIKTMKAERAQEVLNNLYGLLMEMNLLRSDEDVLSSADVFQDSFVQRHLRNIKQLSAKYAAISNRNQFEVLIDEFRKLKETGVDELKRLLRPEDLVELQPLFRKFEEITTEDEEAILEDQEFLQLLKHLKKKLDEK